MEEEERENGVLESVIEKRRRERERGVFVKVKVPKQRTMNTRGGTNQRR